MRKIIHFIIGFFTLSCVSAMGVDANLSPQQQDTHHHSYRDHIIVQSKPEVSEKMLVDEKGQHIREQVQRQTTQHIHFYPVGPSAPTSQPNNVPLETQHSKTPSDAAASIIPSPLHTSDFSQHAASPFLKNSPSKCAHRQKALQQLLTTQKLFLDLTARVNNHCQTAH